ncbi:hypothetical protein D4R52_01190 [bacterium]|nr:MAG: hypothetical protein D4R52_01190 [bacterium]
MYFYYMHDLLKDLNDRQREAVTAPLGPVLVLAGAGSGKTRVLTYRIAHLLKEKLFKPEDLLALTFTNKAAGEMKERIGKLLDSSLRGSVSDRSHAEGRSASGGQSSNPSQIAVRLSGARNDTPITMGTFHSVCVRILRADIHHLKDGHDRNFVIYDADDSLRVLKHIILEKNLDAFRPQTLSFYISAAKNRLVAPRDISRAFSLDNDYLERTIKDVYQSYENVLRQNNALDFDDLLKKVCDLFRADPKVLKKYQDRFKYILVDEYQDTNHAQYVMLKSLVARSASLRATTNNIFVVGDDAQSIYGFRGANMQNILDFKKDYRGAKVIMLEQNYRSTQGILDVAHEIIKLNPEQYEKKLWTDKKTGDQVNLYEAADEMDEAQFVLHVIARSASDSSLRGGLKDDEAISSSNGIASSARGGLAMTEKGNNARNDKEIQYVSEDTPIFDRFLETMRRRRQSPVIFNSNFSVPNNLKDFVILYRTHAQSRPFEEALLGSGISYQIVGGIKFYERKEIKDAVAYLRLLQNPRDLVSMARVINTPARGIGAGAFSTLTKALVKYDFSIERMVLNLEGLELRAAATAGAKLFFETLDSAARLAPGESLPDLMHFLLKRSGYKEHLLDGTSEGETRWENIEELFNAAAKYAGKQNIPWREALPLFLEEIALMTDLDKMDEGGDKLTLMTLHSAKGLEFDNVFFVGLEEGLLPHSRSIANPSEISEEIRLAYVGVTRARKNLYLSFARTRQSYGELKQCVPSRILKAIPKRLIRKIT